ncbi:MAG: transposase [Verrucomicrobia bacterium]|nr:transposase [Verrucomicrobiota bacterium]
MPRQLRIEYAGAIYHVMNRGDRRESIFKDKQDRTMFLATLAETCARSGWQIHAWCLMRNHFHLVLETPQANLVVGMKWLLGVYTKRFNIRHRGCGHVFAGRYKALMVDGSGDGYLRTVCDYVHLNPVRAKLIKPEAPLASFRWSSYPDYLKAREGRPAWLRVDRLFGERGIPKDTAAGRREFGRQMEQRRREANEADEELRQRWWIGSEAFRKELLAAAGERVGRNHYGAERRESGQEMAERLVGAGLARLGWTAKELIRRPKGDQEKVKLAGELRKATTMTFAWIAQRLHMGSWTYVANLLYEMRKNECK